MSLYVIKRIKSLHSLILRIPVN